MISFAGKFDVTFHAAIITYGTDITALKLCERYKVDRCHGHNSDCDGTSDTDCMGLIHSPVTKHLTQTKWVL